MPLANFDELYPLYHDGFGEDSYEFFCRFFNTAADFSCIYKDGLPISMGFLVEKRALIFGTEVKVGYLSGLCTKTEYRGNGLISEIIRGLLQKGAQRKYPLLFLSPFDDNFYKKYGFKDLTRYDADTYKIKAGAPIEKTFQPSLKSLIEIYEKASAGCESKLVFGTEEARLKTEEFFCDKVPVSIVYENAASAAFFFETEGCMEFFVGDDSLLERAESGGLKKEVIRKNGSRSYLQCRACDYRAFDKIINHLSPSFQIKEAELKQNSNITNNGENSSFSSAVTEFYTDKAVEILTKGKSFFMDKY